MNTNAFGVESSSIRRGFMRHLLRAVVWSAFIASAPAVFAQAGVNTGEITGTVTDPAGAQVPNATVTATNTATGFKQSAKTGESGVYRLALLPLGTYDLETQASG